MSLSTRRLAMTGAYSAMLEKLIPRLEELLYNKLERLETNVARHETRHGLSASQSKYKAAKKPRRAVDTDLNVGRPSVILLGSRLNSDRLYCRALIQRVATVIRVKLAGGGRRIHSDGRN